MNLLDPVDAYNYSHSGSLIGRDTGTTHQNIHNSLNYRGNAQDALAQRRAIGEEYQRRQQEYQEAFRQYQLQRQAFEAEQRRKEQEHAMAMKERAHQMKWGNYEATSRINAANAPAMAMANQFGNVANNAYQSAVPNVNLLNSNGTRIGGSFSGLGRSLLG